MPKHIQVTVHDPERVATFTKVFGSPTVCVKSFATTLISTPDHDEIPAYMLDLAMITPEQYERLVVHIAERFKLPLDEVLRDLADKGMPILQRDTTLVMDDLRFLI